MKVIYFSKDAIALGKKRRSEKYKKEVKKHIVDNSSKI